MVYPLNVGQNVEYTLDGGKNWLRGLVTKANANGFQIGDEHSKRAATLPLTARAEGTLRRPFPRQEGRKIIVDEIWASENAKWFGEMVMLAANAENRVATVTKTDPFTITIK